jgi:SAM-dependent methyltransferase
MSSFRFDFGAAGNATDVSGAVAPAAAPATAADADAASATSRPITRIAAVQATAAVTRVVEAGGERFDLAVAESSQVVEAGVYEGGRELWECAIDLVEWLAAHRRASGTVLELGCGRGLPGLWCLKRGAQQVVFSDYDADVLERYTRVDAARVGGRSFFYGGDWRGLPAALTGDGFGTFDLMLSAETAYREDTTRSLVECIARTLSATGEAVVATKRYYFGCGGGVAALENEIGRVDRLCCEVVWSAEDGRSNVRDILRVFWKEGG